MRRCALPGSLVGCFDHRRFRVVDDDAAPQRPGLDTRIGGSPRLRQHRGYALLAAGRGGRCLVLVGSDCSFDHVAQGRVVSERRQDLFFGSSSQLQNSATPASNSSGASSASTLSARFASSVSGAS